MITLMDLKTALEFYADSQNWAEIETGIGMMPSPAECDGGEKAREILTKWLGAQS